jgi:hypothetical protein
MGHEHNYKSCRDGVCGDTIVTCKHCRADVHCYTIPENWVDCCKHPQNKCPHKGLYVLFCSTKCRDVYMNVYDREINLKKKDS